MEAVRHIKTIFRAAFYISVIYTCALIAVPAQAPDDSCSESVGDFQGSTVRSLQVVPPRWSKGVTLPRGNSDILSEGEEFTTERLGNTMTAVRKSLKASGVDTGFNILERVGAVAVTLVPSPCVRPVPKTECEKLNRTNCVDVTIRPYHVAVDFYRAGKNFLPIPRANLPTSLPKVPKPLRLLNPTFGVRHDRGFGPSAYAAIETDLLDPYPSPQVDEEKGDRFNLYFRAAVDKSLSKRFYTSGASLSLNRERQKGFWQTIGADGNFYSSHEPYGGGEKFTNQGRIGLNLRLRPRVTLVDSATVKLNYRFSNDRFFNPQINVSESARENAFELRMLLDGRIARGPSRLALWIDANRQLGGVSYTRFSALYGYSKEIPVRLNQTIGIEVLAGAGRVSGNGPEYSRFHAGNSMTDFLYVEEPNLLFVEPPSGPILRSVGENRGSLLNGKGATSYAHTNINLSFPIPSLSRPLIPNEPIDENDEEEDPDLTPSAPDPNIPSVCRATSSGRATLKTLVKSSVRSSFNVIQRYYRNHGMTPEEAKKAAGEDLREICPGVFYIADYANLFALKPMVMFDASYLSGGQMSRTNFAAGPGLQVVLVTARFEIGYMAALNRAAGESSGNLVFRLTFQNLF